MLQREPVRQKRLSVRFGLRKVHPRRLARAALLTFRHVGCLHPFSYRIAGTELLPLALPESPPTARSGARPLWPRNNAIDRSRQPNVSPLACALLSPNDSAKTIVLDWRFPEHDPAHYQAFFLLPLCRTASRFQIHMNFGPTHMPLEEWIHSRRTGRLPRRQDL